MNCEEFEKELEELDDNSNPSPVALAHQGVCASCSELVEDLNFIRTQARTMLTLEPPERVWEQIEQKLKQERLIALPKRHRWFGDAPAFGWIPRLSMGMAYAAVFSVALGVVYLYSIFSPHVSAPPVYSILAPPANAVPLPPPPDPPFAQLFEKVPPEKRAIYVSNLDQIESSIQHLQTFMAAHPEDPFARDELLNTYQQKSRLWEDLVRWEEF